MAGISQKVAPDDVLALLAHNVYIQGYGDGRPTEFLILLDRYVHQARELQTMAGPSATIHVERCEDAGPLLQILGYRLRQGCGEKGVSLVTSVPERAFLTIDSGFPLTNLEEALQKNVPFTYPYASSRVPTMFRESDWVVLSSGKRLDTGDMLNLLMHDPEVARLYWALTKNDTDTRNELKRAPGLRRLLPYAPVMDFYGSEICIRSGKVVVPGDAAAAAGWKDLVGVSPDSSGDFVAHLLDKDSGWLAAYFDVLSRVSKEQQAHLTQSPRLKHLYEAFRSSEAEGAATKGVFRKAPELLVLFTNVQWEPNGEPRIPGNLAVWKEILNQKTDLVTVKNWSKRAHGFDNPEQLLEAMTAFARIQTDTGPLQIYITLNAVDSARTTQQRISPETVRLLANKFSQFNSWYLVFTEFPDLNDTSIGNFVNTAGSIDSISNQTLRGNVLGSFQANIGLWQILARQGQIPGATQNASWQKVIEPFAKVSSSMQLFDAAHNSLAALMLAAGGKANLSEDEFIDLLAGPVQTSLDGQRMHQEMTARIHTVLDDQHLVSLDTLLGLNDGLKEMAEGKPAPAGLLTLAGELREFEMPRPIFTNNEKIIWAPRIYSSRHAELQVKTDLTKVINGPGTKVQLETARGQLAPFLRDTLVGLNYAYYEPPGAQMLHNNPLFVRAHDFSGLTIMGYDRTWGVPELLGAGTPAGGGAYLMGSLADLPYALASGEQDFIAPENVQALIWKELVPELLLNATLSRWWNVSPIELHAVTLYQKSGEEILTASGSNEKLRGQVISILSDRMTPQRLEWADQTQLNAARMAAIVPRMMPADMFYLAAEFRRRYPDEAAAVGPADQQLDALCRQHPTETNWAQLSRDFGAPHPAFTRSYARGLLNVKPMPFFGGYSSRLFGESWDSGNLYWARLADEMGYSPVMMTYLVPELTRHMIIKIFATDLEDWPALLRAMQETGDEFRQGKISLPPAGNAISQHQSTQ
jgi:hypothetical protein